MAHLFNAQVFMPGVDDVPDDIFLEALVPALTLMQPPSAKWTAWVQLLNERDPPVCTAHDLTTNMVHDEVADTMRDKRVGLPAASLRVVARLLHPKEKVGFQWRRAVAEKRKAGCNGNNVPSLTLDDQLEQEGVDNLPRSWTWPSAVWDGVPKKGSATTLDDDGLNIFLDNLWLAAKKVRASRLARACAAHPERCRWFRRCRSCATSCGPSGSSP